MDKALIALLEEKPLAYITVSDICKQANVSRSTFYLHYENIGDLLRETSHYLIDSFVSYFPAREASLSARLSEGKDETLLFLTPEYLHPYLTYLRDNAHVFSTALAHMQPLGFEGAYRRLFWNVLDPILEHFRYPTADRRYVMAFYLNGINALVCIWLEGGCRESIEEMTRIIRECVLGAGGEASCLRQPPPRSEA